MTDELSWHVLPRSRIFRLALQWNIRWCLGRRHPCFTHGHNWRRHDRGNRFGICIWTVSSDTNNSSALPSDFNTVSCNCFGDVVPPAGIHRCLTTSHIFLIFSCWCWTMTPMVTEWAKNEHTRDLNPTASRRITMRCTRSVGGVRFQYG